jgi:hypothetical protein
MVPNLLFLSKLTHSRKKWKKQHKMWSTSAIKKNFPVPKQSPNWAKILVTLVTTNFGRKGFVVVTTRSK